MFPRTFTVERVRDETGTSGTGIVTEGVVFKDGHTVIRWLTEVSSTTQFDSFEQFMMIHIGPHPANFTRIRFSDGEVIEPGDWKGGALVSGKVVK